MEAKKGPASHSLNLLNREHLKVEGVIQIGHFEDQKIILDTIMGSLILKGDNLNITQLNLETGSLVVDGILKSLEYVEGGSARGGKKSLFKRLLK